MGDMYINDLKTMESFSRSDLFQAMCRNGGQISNAAFKRKLQAYLKDGTIMRVGRNMYCVPQKEISVYEHRYSTTAKEVADLVAEKHPFLSFSIFELVQLNEFVNHQLAHNIIFVSVEADIINFVFDTLKERYPGRVLITPTKALYQQYWRDGMIVLEKLVSEAPMGKPVKWHIRIEKLLVDIMADKLILDTVSQSEYPGIYMNAFERYAIDESCMFRYAKRRGAESNIRSLIQDNTDIVLRTEN